MILNLVKYVLSLLEIQARLGFPLNVCQYHVNTSLELRNQIVLQIWATARICEESKSLHVFLNILPFRTGKKKTFSFNLKGSKKFDTI